ncbi:MAG TPA: hypothetical protein ENJ45_05935, partial [Phaeodactylibacter sp.]|nr:hypothetical protein [Phaeodactylibacter sp.]
MPDAHTYDIIIMALFRWKGPYNSTSISLAKEWSKTHRVFYINHPYTYRDYFGILKQPTYKDIRAALRKGYTIYEREAGGQP